MTFVHSLLRDPYNYNNSIFKRNGNFDFTSATNSPDGHAPTLTASALNFVEDGKGTSSDPKKNTRAVVGGANPNPYISPPPEYAHSLICTCSS